jgi:hypothetical protein
MFSRKIVVAKLLVDASGSLQCPQASTYADHSEDYCEAGTGLSQSRMAHKDNKQFVKTQRNSSKVKKKRTRIALNPMHTISH